MKETPSFLSGAALALCVSVFSITPAGAIPNQVGGITFINPANMRLEDFANRAQTWQRNAELKGPWEMWRDDAVTDTSIEMLRLKIPAIVFGVMAEEVTLQRRDMKISQFSVVFKPDEKKNSDLKKLDKILRKNAAIWAGDASLKTDAITVTIESDSDNNQAVITFTPIAAVASAD